MKRILKVVLTLTFGLGLVSFAQAAINDRLTVTIMPNAYYSVEVDTETVALDLGAVDMSASTQTVSPATVTINSTYATTDLKLQGAIAASANPWSFDDDSASAEANQIAAWATFTSVERSSAPTQTGDYFSGTVPGTAASDLVDASDRYVGSSAADGTSNLFENNTEDATKDMDAMPPDPDAAAKSHLWLYFRMPSASSGNAAQNITFTLTAVVPN